MRLLITSSAILAASAIATSSSASVVPFTESFSTDAANWFTGDSAGPASWVETGGADGGGYVSWTAPLPDPIPQFGSVIFRGEDNLDSSGDGFVGNWIEDGVTSLRFSLRHDGPEALSVFVRFASSNNFPAAVGIAPVNVDPGEWVSIDIDVTESSPFLQLEGAPYSDVFSSIGNLQIGVLPGEAFAGASVTFDLDEVMTVPGPAAWTLLTGLAVVGGRRRRV